MFTVWSLELLDFCLGQLGRRSFTVNNVIATIFEYHIQHEITPSF